MADYMMQNVYAKKYMYVQHLLNLIEKIESMIEAVQGAGIYKPDRAT